MVHLRARIKYHIMESNSIKIKDKVFSPYIRKEELNRIIDQVADRINADYQGKEPLFLVVLNGAMIFAADLFKRITVPCTISTIRVSSYCGMSSTGEVKELAGLTENITGRDVIIVEDIVDTGITMGHLLKKLRAHQPASLKLCSLLFKPEKFTGDYPIDYLGRAIPNEFVVGYGFDYDEFGRNYPEIYSIKE